MTRRMRALQPKEEERQKRLRTWAFWLSVTKLVIAGPLFFSFWASFGPALLVAVGAAVGGVVGVQHLQSDQKMRKSTCCLAPPLRAITLLMRVAAVNAAAAAVSLVASALVLRWNRGRLSGVEKLVVNSASNNGTAAVTATASSTDGCSGGGALPAAYHALLHFGGICVAFSALALLAEVSTAVLLHKLLALPGFARRFDRPPRVALQIINARTGAIEGVQRVAMHPAAAAYHPSGPGAAPSASAAGGTTAGGTAPAAGEGCANSSSSSSSAGSDATSRDGEFSDIGDEYPPERVVPPPPAGPFEQAMHEGASGEADPPQAA